MIPCWLAVFAWVASARSAFRFGSYLRQRPLRDIWASVLRTLRTPSRLEAAREARMNLKVLQEESHFRVSIIFGVILPFLRDTKPDVSPPTHIPVIQLPFDVEVLYLHDLWKWKWGMADPPEVTILLLGDADCGKSTFLSYVYISFSNPAYPATPQCTSRHEPLSTSL